MRTDLYFVLQDVTRCRDLYGDGVAYTKYAARRALRRTTAPDPSLELPAHERRAVRAYSVVLVVGTTLCLAFLATVTLPADITLFARAVAHLGPATPRRAPRRDGRRGRARRGACAVGPHVVARPPRPSVLVAGPPSRPSQPVVPAGRPSRSS
ncbi:hypothetical protein O1M63_14515 [Streptomyces mirabilis]|nr:hypothetical protein [Streptomyces mirabilis]